MQNFICTQNLKQVQISNDMEMAKSNEIVCISGAIQKSDFNPADQIYACLQTEILEVHQKFMVS